MNAWKPELEEEHKRGSQKREGRRNGEGDPYAAKPKTVGHRRGAVKSKRREAKKDNSNSSIMKDS